MENAVTGNGILKRIEKMESEGMSAGKKGKRIKSIEGHEPEKDGGQL